MGFNAEQAKAIDVSSSKDVLISAGAGSGKTKTLSERVFRLVHDGEVKPSELLVLTFTNNSAHDMKKKILARFGEDDPLYGEMLSAHIQSFDSFNAYLVRSYSGRLGLAPSFGLIPDTIMDSKKSLFVDEVLTEAYQDDSLRLELLDFMTRLGLKNDRIVKSCLLALLGDLERLSPSKRDDFLKNYQAKFETEDFAFSLYKNVVGYYKSKLRAILIEAYAIDQISHEIVSDEPFDYERAADYIQNRALYQSDIHGLSISPDLDSPNDFLNDEFHEFVDLTDLNDEEFVLAAGGFLENHEGDYFARNYKGCSKNALNDCSYHKPVFVCLKKCKEVLKDAASLSALEKEKEKMAYFSANVKTLLRLCAKVNARLDAYRKEHNAFTFGDVTAMALSLFLEPAYEDIAEEIRTRFTYVMVDEYQDTNDGQEIFLEGLLKKRKDGSRAHIFCVGDAKQSIYAFRSSNVALFRSRQARYLKENEEAMVIAMNKNYRSAKRLLQDINHIFSAYMTLELGGTDYLDPMERLTYDDAVNLYNEELPAYGIHRILPPDSYRFMPSKRVVLEGDREAEYEAKAILADIQAKLSSGYLVFDREEEENHVRPCKYSDFCILVRKKASVPVYQKLFNENGIPINNHVNVDLKEVRAVILLQSLLNALCYIDGDKSIDLPHTFASIARSYVFQYEDERIHKILSCGEIGDVAVIQAIEDDSIMKSLRAFYEVHKDDAFHTLFLALLDEFEIIEKLYLIGEVEDNLAKIESLYSLLLSEEQLGDGLRGFVALFHDIDKHRLSLSSESVQESVNAVDLMTIHASKGLERKIVYMPSSENGISRGNNLTKPPFDFSAERGISFPYLAMPSEDEPTNILTLPMREAAMNPIDEEEQEHVRLLYVALTRAENSVIVVGRNKGEHSVYVMFQDVPAKLSLSPEVLALSSPTLVREYEDVNRLVLPFKMDLPLASQEGKEAYESIYQTYLRKELSSRRLAAAYQILRDLYYRYRDSFAEESEDLDALAQIYGATFYPNKAVALPIVDFASLLTSFGQKEEEAEDDDDEEEPQDYVGEMSAERLKKILADFRDGVLKGDAKSAFPLLKLKKDISAEEVEKIFVDALLYVFARRYGHLPYLVYETYQAPDYPDEVSIYDSASFQGKSGASLPNLPPLEIDDEAIAFASKERKRASKKVSGDEDLPDPNAIERGNRLHRYMELLDFDSKDLSFIKDEKERALIQKAISTPLMQMAFAAEKAFREYGYFDAELGTTGYIDLLFVKDGVYHIVDYKSSHIDDPDYDEQLKAYARNVMRLFGVERKQIRMHLLSLSKAIVREVE